MGPQRGPATSQGGQVLTVQQIVHVVLVVAVPKGTPDGEVQALADVTELDVKLEDLPGLKATINLFNANR
jgi:hypothetical protein